MAPTLTSYRCVSSEQAVVVKDQHEKISGAFLFESRVMHLSASRAILERDASISPRMKTSWQWHELRSFAVVLFTGSGAGLSMEHTATSRRMVMGDLRGAGRTWWGNCRQQG